MGNVGIGGVWVDDTVCGFKCGIRGFLGMSVCVYVCFRSELREIDRDGEVLKDVGGG